MPEMELWAAARAAGLDMERLWRGEYDPKFLARVIAYHNLSTLVEMHREDARLARQESEQRKQRGRRR